MQGFDPENNFMNYEYLCH
jgi:hypothetical protein